jgi:hypothetical protein
MKNVILTNTKYLTLLEALGEEARKLSQSVKDKINKETDDLARELYGKDYGQENQNIANMYNLKGYKNDVDVKGGPFSVGNEKLSPDTLIINFTSAFGCPSAGMCPITQAACYAVAGENRLEGTRSKNVKVHKLVSKAYGQNKIDRVFNIAKLYIQLLADSKKPIKWVRFNEAGDFPTQKILDAATQFAIDVENQYGVKCMAYTANGKLNFQEASKHMAINASTNQVLNTVSDESPKRNFFGVSPKTFDYEYEEDKYEENKIEQTLANNPKTEEAPKEVLKKLEINGTLPNDITVPILQYGKWGYTPEEEGYYYVCPCTFWKDRKDQIALPYCHKFGCKDKRALGRKFNRKDQNGKVIKGKEVKELEKMLSPIKSPCGVSCAVCHDRKGGILKGSNKIIKDYAVLTGIHGSTGSKFNPEYAAKKRKGEDAKWSENNPQGRWNNLDNRGQHGKIPQKQ